MKFNVGELLAILSTGCGGVIWLLTEINKRAKRREEARIKAREIDMKLLNLEANDGRQTEELQELRKDFAEFVQQLLFNKTK